MLTLLVAAIIAPLGADTVGPRLVALTSDAAVRVEQASVRITLNGGDYNAGDEVRVQVEPGDDGYLIVFRVDGDNRVRVLFPLDPDLDSYVRGGRRYELRGRGERTTFLADDRGGNGLIYAALARQPLVFSDYAIDEQWDYEMLRLRNANDDPEAELNTMVRRMAANGRFDYDVVGYRVNESTYASSGGSYGVGGAYDPFYDPYWNCLACGYRTGLTVHIGSRYGSRGWYDPWDPWYYGDAGYGYRNYGGWGSGWGGWYDPYRPIVVYPTRPRPVVPSTPYGYRSRPRQFPDASPGSFAPDLGGNIRPVSRPVSNGGTSTYDGRSRVRNGDTRPTRTTPERRTERSPSQRESPPQRAEPQRESPPQRAEPQRETRPAERPSSPPSGGGYEGRSRRPSNELGDSRPVSMPAVDRQATTVRRLVPDGERPVFREPVRVERPREAETTRDRDPRPEARPVYREPPRSERPAPRETQREAPPQRVERPVAREAPPQRVERPAPSKASGADGGRARRSN